jgi:hypothetical protein
MNERELLVDCLRRLNRAGVIYYLTGSMASNKSYLRHWAQALKLAGELERLLSGEIKPKQT